MLELFLNLINKKLSLVYSIVIGFNEKEFLEKILDYPSIQYKHLKYYEYNEFYNKSLSVLKKLDYILFYIKFHYLVTFALFLFFKYCFS